MTPFPLIANQMLCIEPYTFSFHEIDRATHLTGDGTWTLYCLEGEMTIDTENVIRAGDIVNHCGPIDLNVADGSAKFFLLLNVGVYPAIEFMEIVPASSAYRVTKPWGEEIWLTGRHRGDYCMKRIHIKAGHQTSLQYHNEKVETNVLVEGHIELIGASPYNELVHAPSYVNVKPPTVHRIRALSDIVLVEASTAHLDDVVRLQDDSNRPSGRIEEEHKQ